MSRSRKKKAGLAGRGPLEGRSTRTTMADVAALAGVHQTTVSLALRSHPSIPKTTRERIQRAASRLGYRPDPLLAAFIHRRTSGHLAHSAPQIAFVSDQPSAAAADSSACHREWLEGARSMARSKGVGLERFFIGPGQLSPSRLNQVLETRGIGGVLLGAFSLATRELPLDWTRLAGLRIESFHVAPALDCIAADHRQCTRLAVERLRELGYCRIGIALSGDEDRRLDHQHRIGYLVEHPPQDTAAPIPPLLWDGGAAAPPPTLFATWLRRHQVDAVIGTDPALARLLESVGMERGFRPALAVVPASGADGSPAGAGADHRLVGARAVELLATRLGENQRGLPACASVSYVPGEWRPGASAPPRRAPSADCLGQM